RSKDVIVLPNGENVYPEELETHYSRSPFIKDICIMGVSQNGSLGKEILHAIVVPDMEEFRRRGQTAIREMIRFEIENLSKQVPSFYRIHSIAVRNEPLPRTVTRKLKRFEIQQEEDDSRQSNHQSALSAGKRIEEDYPDFREGAGKVIAELVRESKPDAGPLDPSTNIELDLGYDSLARVELLGLAEARLGVHIDEQQATQIFTLGEMVKAFETDAGSGNAIGRSWREILAAAPENDAETHHIFKSRPLLNPV